MKSKRLKDLENSQSTLFITFIGGVRGGFFRYFLAVVVSKRFGTNI